MKLFTQVNDNILHQVKSAKWKTQSEKWKVKAKSEKRKRVLTPLVQIKSRFFGPRVPRRYQRCSFSWACCCGCCLWQIFNVLNFNVMYWKLWNLSTLSLPRNAWALIGLLMPILSVCLSASAWKLMAARWKISYIAAKSSRHFFYSNCIHHGPYSPCISWLVGLV